MTVIKKANSDDKEMAENRRVQMLIRRKASGVTQTAEKAGTAPPSEAARRADLLRSPRPATAATPTG